MISDGNGGYVESTEGFPTDMKFNSELSGCIDLNGNRVNSTLTYSDGIVSILSDKTSYCYVYFDEINTVYNRLVKDYKNNNGVSHLSSTASNTYPVYYYTGNITNNNIIFGNFCWKMVITTETGGVKLLYNGIPSVTSDGTKTCDNTGTASQLESTKAFNSSSNSPAYVGYMYNTVYEYTDKTMSSVTESIIYGNSFTYNNGVYTLKNTTSFSDFSSNYSTINNYHYTCFNTTGNCTSVYYIYNVVNPTAYYITLTDGKSIENAINEMLYNSDVNTKDSTIKSYIDEWYGSSIVGQSDSNGKLYTSYLENPIFCNDKTITSLGGWNPNGGDVTKYMMFDFDNFECKNKHEQFTLSVENGGTLGYGNNALKYPVGLLSYYEVKLTRGGTNSSYSNSLEDYWLFSAYSFTDYGARNANMALAGNKKNHRVDYIYGVRPVVSLSSNVQLATIGDGSVNNPYIAVLY